MCTISSESCDHDVGCPPCSYVYVCVYVLDKVEVELGLGEQGASCSQYCS